MKKIAFAAAALALTLGFAAPSFAADTYKLEPTHTSVTFQWTHFGFSHPSGKFMNAVGSVTLDQAAPAKSSVEVSFAIAGVNTGVPLLDKEFQEAGWFDAAKYPNATFKSTKVEVTGKDTAKVTGDLTIHGVTKPITLDVKLNQTGPEMGKPTVGFTATGTLNRSDFGLGQYVSAGVSDKIDLAIEAEAHPDK